MAESTLKVDSCNQSHCKLQLSFGTDDRFRFRLLNSPRLKYEITVNNVTKGKMRKFSTGFWICAAEGKLFNLPLENIEGDPADLFDIIVGVYYRRGLEDGNSISFNQVELMYYERILENRLLKAGMHKLS